ncbi:MAG: Rho termination factor N-terminal domain-containing protein [Candidatus Sericytochromatia bacterium]|nr:Rho termination factor N-terminal domain-containing protein [Candidatus Sericytochromatia bacterium]
MSLSDKSKTELAILAKELKIKNYSKLGKEQLIDLIQKAQSKSQMNISSEPTVTDEYLQNVAEARVDMEEESNMESNESFGIEKDAQNKSTFSNNDDFATSEGYQQKPSYKTI